MIDVEIESDYLIIGYFKNNGIKYRCEMEDTGKEKTFTIINENNGVKVDSMLVLPHIPVRLKVVDSFVNKFVKRCSK